MISAQPTAGTGYELDAIAAVVLGGTSLADGRGRIVGTLIGSVILGVLLNVPFFTQLLIKGVVIILAVAIDSLKQRPGLFQSAGTDLPAHQADNVQAPPFAPGRADLALPRSHS